MQKITCIAVFLMLAGIHSGTHAQSMTDSLNRLIPVADLQNDLQQLQSQLKSSQPGLDLYTSKDSLNQIFERIHNSITEPLTSVEFFRKVTPLNKALRNLHTRIWASAAYEKATETFLPRFPFDIYWHDGKMYVLRNHSSDERIVPGSVIKSINGETAASVFQIILDHRVRDGFNETYPLAQSSRNFSYYYAQLIGTPERFVLDLTLSDGSNYHANLAGITGTHINQSRISKYKRKYSQHSEDWDAWISEKQPAFHFDIEGNVAIMTLKTFHVFSIEGGGQDFRKFIHESFQKIQKSNVENLILDMRNNHGGHDIVGMLLMSYLHDSTFMYYRRRISFVKLEGKSVKKGNVYEYIGRGEWIGKVTPQKNVYKGKVYVLMNGYCVSAAGEFIGHLKNIQRATFIGEETGGNPVVFTGGQSQAVDLTHSRITGTIPLQLVEMNVALKNDGHGVRPDHSLHPTIFDVLDEKDIEMELALKLIGENLRP